MMIGYSKEKLMAILLKGRKNALSIGIILFTLIITSIIFRAQGKKIESLHIKKDTEQKKNEVLNEISLSEKTIQLYKNLLSKKEASLVMNTVGSLARESNVSLISISSGNEENLPFYIKTPFILVIGADSYNAIGKFISKIENQPEIYFLDEINISLQQKSPAKDKELSQPAKPATKLIVNLILSIIAIKG